MSKTEVKFSKKELSILDSLLRVAESGWYTIDTLPKGVVSVKQAEQLVRSIQSKIS